MALAPCWAPAAFQGGWALHHARELQRACTVCAAAPAHTRAAGALNITLGSPHKPTVAERMEGIITAPLHVPPGPFGNEGFWALKQYFRYFPKPVSVGSFLYQSQSSWMFKASQKQQPHTYRKGIFPQYQRFQVHQMPFIEYL